MDTAGVDDHVTLRAVTANVPAGTSAIVTIRDADGEAIESHSVTAGASDIATTWQADGPGRYVFMVEAAGAEANSGILEVVAPLNVFFVEGEGKGTDEDLRPISGLRVRAITEDGTRRQLVDVLADAGVIVNGILQDTDRPLMFLEDGDVERFVSGALIVDVSCDLGMGFPFARPTSFEEPTFAVGGVTYYAVDHTPTYLWRSASWELSRVVVPFIETVIDGPEAWEGNATIRRAIEIREGVIRNPKVLSFQSRAAEYPHPISP